MGDSMGDSYSYVHYDFIIVNDLMYVLSEIFSVFLNDILCDFDLPIFYCLLKL